MEVQDWELLSDFSGPVPSLHSQDNRCRRGHLRIPGGCRTIRECLCRVLQFQVMTYSSEPGVAHPPTAGRPGYGRHPCKGKAKTRKQVFLGPPTHTGTSLRPEPTHPLTRPAESCSKRQGAQCPHLGITRKGVVVILEQIMGTRCLTTPVKESPPNPLHTGHEKAEHHT